MSWWPWSRKETKVEPPRTDLASDIVADWQAEAKLRETEERGAELREAARRAREVAHRVDRFTREMDGSFRRLGNGHG